jgi:hypothetical protein
MASRVLDDLNYNLHVDYVEILYGDSGGETAGES